MRTTRHTLTFEQPFSLSGVDEVQPAGTYAVAVDEELIEGLSFPAYQRVATTIYLPLGTGILRNSRRPTPILPAA
jgi:hypothetical protein